MFWSRAEIKCLIRGYKQYPHLYNPEHENYYDRPQRDKSFNALTQTLRKYKPGLTVTDVKKKLKNLRNQFQFEKKRVLKNGPEYFPKFWCYNYLEFLGKHSKKTEVKKFMRNFNKDLSIEETQDAQLDADLLPKPAGKANLINEASTTLRYAKMLKTQGEPDMTKEEIFGQFVVAQLKQISNHDLYTDATWAIQVALRKAIQRDDRLKDTT